MKKAAFVFTLLAATAVSAANVKIMFSTPGPDTYADGTPVLKGERYALVWKAAAEDVFSITADGSTTGGKLVFCHETTEAGRCSPLLFQAPENWIKAQGMAGGVWSVQLLDTRVFNVDADGKSVVTFANLVNGVPVQINGAGDSAAPVKVAANDEAVPTSTGAADAVNAKETALPASVAGTNPIITNIEIKGAFVHVTVANTLPFVNYGLESGAEPGKLGVDAAAPQAGKATTDDTITLISPKAEGCAQFFKVNRK